MRTLTAVMLLAALSMHSGCAVMHQDDETWEVHPISKAGAEVQTASYKKRGIIIVTSDATAGGLPTVTVGTVDVTITRVPSFPPGFVVPSVTATSTLDATTGAHLVDSLEVGTYFNEAEEADDATTAEGDLKP